MEEEAVAASAEGRIGAKEGGESEEAAAAQAGSVQERRKQDTTGKSSPAQSRTPQGSSS